MIQEENQKASLNGATDEGTDTDENGNSARTTVVDADRPGSLENPNTPFLVLAKLTAMCMVVGTGSFMILVFAGLATVLLLLRSRSATLRQINANLLQISEQLKGPGPAQTAPSGQ
jgi:hypothetical protein